MKGHLWCALLPAAFLLTSCSHYKSKDDPADKYIQDARAQITSSSDILAYNNEFNILLEGLSRYDPRNAEKVTDLDEYNKLVAFYSQAMKQALDYCRQQIKSAKTDNEIIVANMCLTNTNYKWTHSVYHRSANLERFSQYGASQSEIDNASETLAKINYKLSKQNDAPTESENRNNRFSRLLITWFYDNPTINGSESKNLKSEIQTAYNNMIHYIVVRDDSGYLYDHEHVVKKYILPQVLRWNNVGDGTKRGVHTLEDIYANRVSNVIYFNTGRLAPFVQYDIVDKPSPTGLNYYLNIGIDSISNKSRQNQVGGETTTVQNVENECYLVRNEDYDKNSRKRGDKSSSQRRLKKECSDVVTESEVYTPKATFDMDIAYIKYHYQLKDRNGNVLLSGASESSGSNMYLTDEDGNTSLYDGNGGDPAINELKKIGDNIAHALMNYMGDQCGPNRTCL